LSIACEERDYPQRATAKLDEWTRKGKRLQVSVNWVEPSNASVKGFWDNKPSELNSGAKLQWLR
jgi:hypothetical protein